ncbi:metallo-beta-lactamase superfamily protein [Xylaria bambusicola]|uniref:metallo-beta-lactamase superfamily protein n=1 Tax=Xylaria bambusicola TaxID=326684 RepID=UPI002008A3C1|nr:metallo-beta-lactamase superfamily protein [Xylaria bambusicola]KAI0503329.1 metallo-beta-lactamase superfamily protein [Xylaria bambusicola]
MATQLVHLPEVERLSPACIRILGGNPSKFQLQGTNTYLVGTGPRRLLIDTGEGKPSWQAALKRVLDEEKATVQAALLTHWHPDHVQGVPQLEQLVSDTAVYKCAPAPGQLNIVDGQVFEVQGATLTAVHTPGHTTDHMAFVFREEDALFTGDNVLGHGTAVFEDLGIYLHSLTKMERLVSGRAYPGHGPVLSQARAKIAEYISHRHQRELQVIETLGSAKDSSSLTTGAWTPMELVKVIYRDVPEELHIPASYGVIQILKKLLAEDKVVLEDGDRWRLKERPTL